MSLKKVLKCVSEFMCVGLASIALFQFVFGATLAAAAPHDHDDNPAHHDRDDDRDRHDRDNDHKPGSPIKHVIVIIGENRTFDHVFATYRPRYGESIWNLLSEGIVKPNGNPGPNF